MICYNCGGKLEKIITNLPFKVKQDCIIIITGLPVLQCQNCNEYLIEDSVMEKVDSILNKIDRTAELEILSYAVQKKLDRFGLHLDQIQGETEEKVEQGETK